MDFVGLLRPAAKPETEAFRESEGEKASRIQDIGNEQRTENMREQPFLIPSVIFFLLSIPLILGLVPPNRGYGIRTPKTMSEPKLWYSANRFGGWALLVSSGIYLALTVVSPSAEKDFTVWLIHLAAFAIPLLVSVLLIRRFINRL